MQSKKVDKTFLTLALLLVASGFFFFTTAAFGLLASKDWESFKSVFVSQVGQGLFLGLIAMYVCSHIHYKHFRKISFFVFIAGCVLCALVFVPGIGFGHGGAHRWIDLRFTTFQPSELLKLGFVLYFAMWLSAAKERIRTFAYGTIPFLVFLGIAAALILTEPDAGTFGIIVVAGLGMFLVAGGKISHIFLIVFIGVAAFGGMVYSKPYLQARIQTFLNPESDTKGSGYQLDQALIAIGSGEMFGRGFGQSIQKFGSLPEATNDSIFAIIGEEFGFAGSAALILLFLFFAMRGFHIAIRAPDQYSGLVVVGLILLMITQSFLNISSQLGLFPLTGVPLIFISHGGTALLFALLETGLIVNISRWQK